MSSYGDEDDDVTSSSDSEDQVLKQFEISVSRSQSFRSAAAYAGVEVSHKAQLQLGRRHKFARLSDQEEGSTELSDCEGTPPRLKFPHVVTSQGGVQVPPVHVHLRTERLPVTFPES